MADKVFMLDATDMEADPASADERIINVYDTYANALAHDAAGLSTVKDIDRLTGLVGSVITQTAKTAGPKVDVHGKLVIFLSDGGGAAGTNQEYFLMSDSGKFGGPRRIVVHV